MLSKWVSTGLTRCLRKSAACLAIGLVVTGSFSVPVRSSPADIVRLTVGKADVIDIEGAIADIMVADPKVADVSVLQSNKLYVVGASIGNTNVILLDSAGNIIRKMDVAVSIDTKAIEALVADLFPKEKDVHVRMIGSQAVLSGSVSTAGVAQKIASLVAAHMGEVQDLKGSVDEIIENLLTVRGEQQVMLRVRMLEVSRDILKELGLETTTDNGGNLTSRIGGSVGVNSKTGLTEDPFGITSLLFDSPISGIGNIEMMVNALERDNLGHVLAEPNLTSVSGEQAGFLAGGEFPVPVGRDRDGNIVIEYKQFGVSLNFKPTVLSDDRISLQLNTEVSSLDSGQGITLSDIQIPGLDVRRASSTVEINSGGSLMMAGLLKSENIKGMAGIPGVKDTPVIGDLISSKSFERQETELVVIVTPYLVQPYADHAQAQPMFEKLGSKLPPLPPTAAMTPRDKTKPKALYTPEQAAEEVKKLSQEERPQIKGSPVNNVFSNNMQKIYGDKVKKNMPQDDQAFGYMLD